MLRLSFLLLPLAITNLAHADEGTPNYVRPAEFIRGVDAHGCGDYPCPRGDRVHNAIDYAITPGDPVRAPISGRIKRFGRPYFDDTRYTLVVIEGEDALLLKVFYITPSVQVGDFVRAGEIVGTAQDISLRYPGITPHLHCEAYVNGRRTNPEEL